MSLPIDELPGFSIDHPIIVFDALCVLCSANAQFVLQHDRRGHFPLASMQGEVGTSLYRHLGMDPANPLSLIVIDGSRIWRDSDAVLAIYAELPWPWRWLTMFRLIPRRLRDPLYRLIARNRYRLAELRSGRRRGVENRIGTIPDISPLSTANQPGT